MPFTTESANIWGHPMGQRPVGVSFAYFSARTEKYVAEGAGNDQKENMVCRATKKVPSGFRKGLQFIITYSLTKGSSAMIRARLIATVSWR